MVIAPAEIPRDVYLTWQSAPAWLVGEDGATRDLKAPDRAALVGDDHYTNDYAGRIQSIREKGRERSRGFWRCVKMALTAEQRKAVRERTLKVEGGALIPVRDEDKWGERLWAGLKDTTTLEDMERDAGQEASPEAARTVLLQKEMAVLRMRLLKEAIPKNIAHTGAGLYKVDDDGATTGDTVASYDDNICPDSEDFNVGTWLAGRLTAWLNQLAAPLNASVSADRIVPTTDDDSHNVRQQATFANATQYTFSIYVKANGYDEVGLSLSTDSFPGGCLAYFDVGAGTVGTEGAGLDSAAIVDVGGGWYRCSITATSTSAGVAYFYAYIIDTGEDFSFVGDPTKGLYVWGAQVEAAAAASTYKPTRASGETSITLQTGGLTDGAHDGEFLNFTVLDRDYQIIRNGVDSVLVTADATGEGGAGTALTFAPHVTHSGALAQLWTDQGATTFTAPQEIRGYAGSYTENIDPNSSLDPTNQYMLRVWANPGDTPSVTGQYTTSGGPHHTHFFGYSIDGASPVINLGSEGHIVDSCSVGQATGSAQIAITGGGNLIIDSELDGKDFGSSYNIHITGGAGATIIRRCTFKDSPRECLLIGDASDQLVIVEACEFWNNGSNSQIYSRCLDTRSHNSGLYVLNCSLLGGTNGIKYDARSHVLRVMNTIFRNQSTGAIDITYGTDAPEIEACCFSNVGSYFVKDSAGSHNSLAAIQSAGYDTLQRSITDNPDFTSETGGSEDLSLQAGSPCINAGIGSGVLTDAAGVSAPNIYHPAMGSDFSRDLAALNAPTFTVVDDGDGTNFTTTIDGDDNVTNYVSYRAPGTSAWTDGGSRSGSGAVQTAAGQGHYDVAVRSSIGGDMESPWSEIGDVFVRPSKSWNDEAGAGGGGSWTHE